MKHLRTSLFSVVVVCLTLWTAQSATAAQTRSLPTGNVLFAVDDNAAIGKIFTVDTLSSTPTALAGSAAVSPCGDSGIQGAFNPANGKAYILCWNAPHTSLYEVNLSSGSTSLIGNVRNGASADIGVISLAVDNQGNAYVLDSNSLYPIDLSTAVVGTPIGAASGWNPIGFAFNPVDQSFYVVSSSTNTSAQLYTIDVSTGVRTLLVNNAGFPVTGSGTDKKVWSIAFDSSGTMWGINRTLGLFSAVVTGTNASDFASSVQIGAAVGAIDAYALFIQNAAPVPTPAPAPTAEPTLANTGTSTSEALRYASLGAALLLGGILMHSRARRIRRNK